MFRDGNVLLLDGDGVIIQPLTSVEYAQRTLKRGEEYVPPPTQVDPRTLGDDELAEILARREAEGDAAGFDRLRAEREVLDLEADMVINLEVMISMPGIASPHIECSFVVTADGNRPLVPQDRSRPVQPA